MKHVRKKNNLDFSTNHWLALLAVSLFFVIIPFDKGLFTGQSSAFESPIYKALAFAFVVVVPSFVFLFRRWKLNSLHGTLSITVLLLPVVYFISSFAGVTRHGAQLMFLIYFFYSVMFIFGLYLAYGKASRKFLEWTLIGSGYLVIIYALLNLFGQDYYPDAMWLAHDGYRLASVFQYSNTYAGFLSAYLFVALYAVSTRSSRVEVGIHAAMLVPILLSMMLTLSRGALVFVPVLILFFLLFLRVSRQVVYVLHLGIAGIVTLFILGKISTITKQIAEIVQPTETKAASPISFFHELPLAGWSILIISSVVLVGGSLAVYRWVTPWLERRLAVFEYKKWSPIALPVISAMAGVIGVVLLLMTSSLGSFLPANIADRLTSINLQQHSVQERLTFYRDAMKVVADYPLIGAGGGAWGSLYEQYQNNPYISRQAHSYFVQTLVEVGLLGFVVVVGFIGLCFFLFIRLFRRHIEHRDGTAPFFILAFSILTHSLIDFDMSFVYIGALVFLSLGAMLSPFKDTAGLTFISRWDNRIMRIAYPAGILILSLVMLTWVFRENSAAQAYAKAVGLAMENRSLNEVLPELDKAIDWSPSQTEYSVMKSDWLIQAHRQTGDLNYNLEAQKEIERAKRYVTHNRNLLLSEYRNLKGFGEYNQAIETLEEGIAKYQWDINFYEAAIMEYLLNGNRLKDDDPSEAKRNWSRGLELYQEIIRRMELLEDLPEEQMQGRNFGISPFTRQAVGQIYYGMGDYESALEVLRPMTSANLSDPYQRAGVRYYLATLHKFGQKDENLQNLLIQADENERIALESLVAD